jgi:hypothetical protein
VAYQSFFRDAGNDFTQGKNRLAQRGHDEAAERPPKGGFTIGFIFSKVGDFFYSQGSNQNSQSRSQSKTIPEKSISDL